MSFLPLNPSSLSTCEFDRQAVAVPARFARDVVALHGLEPREQILEDPRLDVVGAGHAVGGRRAFVERPLRAALRRGQRALEDLRLPPPPQHLVLERRQVDLVGHRGEHQASVVGAPGRCSLRRRDETVPVAPAALPRYHPPWTEQIFGPALVPRRRLYGRDQWPHRSASSSGVIFVACSAPGSHRPRIAHACVRDYSSPSTPSAASESTGAINPRRLSSSRELLRDWK